MKSTLGVAVVSILLLTPFGINNFIQGRHFLGGLTFFVTLICIINAYFCYRGRYQVLLNLLGMAPAFTITIAFVVHELGVTGSYWAYMGVFAFYFILPEKQAVIGNSLFIGIILPIAWNTLDQSVAIRFSAVLFGTSFFAFFAIHEISKQHYLLKMQAVTDALTGLYNRSLLQNSLENVIHQSHRTGMEMTLIMIDIDYFKKINDEFGHDVGDSVLKAFGGFLMEHLRVSDMVFRIGGEEFLALMYNTDEANGHAVAEKLREKIEQYALIPDQTVTVSMGVSCLQSGMNWKQWMKRSDEHLYQAKSNGRNQVVA